jgi:hypothetical protein
MSKTWAPEEFSNRNLSMIFATTLSPVKKVKRKKHSYPEDKKIVFCIQKHGTVRK